MPENTPNIIEGAPKNMNTVAGAEQALAPSTTKVKKVSRKLVIGAFGIVLLGGLIGFLSCYVVFANPGEESFEEKLGKVVESTEGSGIAEVKDEATGETVKVIKVPVGNSDDDVAVREMAEKLFKVANNMIYDGSDWHPSLVRTYNELYPWYRPEGLKTTTEMTLSYGLQFVIDVDGGFGNYNGREEKILNGEVRDALIEELKRNGFTEYLSRPIWGDQYLNEEAGIICGVEGPGLAFRAVCSSVNWYSTDNWDLKDELAEAYKQKEGDYPLIIRVDAGNIKDSGYERYQRLTAGVSNAAGLFYRVNPESEWKFFQATQAEIECSAYNTDDLKRAFVGERCWNTTTWQDDTVKP